MNYITITNLEKQFDGNTILKGVNLSVKKGEIMAVVGPSGSGKSTLLRCINRLLEPDNGTIMVNNKDIRKWSPVDLRRDVILVHQETAMLPGSVYDNVSFGFNVGPGGLGERAQLTASVNHATETVTLNWDQPSSMLPGFRYYILRSTTRDGFWGELGVDYTLLKILPYDTITYQDIGNATPGTQLYYMVIPMNPITGERGSGSYS